ncbi:MAG: acyltransferase [Clostridia bacterium]|nr:acyltransferase [Clostridia bacterium]
MQIEMNDELFLQLTEYCNRSDNTVDNARRAKALGFGEGVRIAPGAIIRLKDASRVGTNVFFGLYTYVNGDVTVGNNVLIGPHCTVSAGNHKFDPATGWFSARSEEDGDDSVVIGDGSWLAGNVCVTGGVKLGRANLVCSGAVVTKSTPDYAIMAGVPARQIGEIDPKTGEYIWYHKGERK